MTYDIENDLARFKIELAQQHEVEEQARELQTKVSQMRVSPSSRVSETIDKILDSLGTGTYLHSTREYSELSKMVRQFQDERLLVIRTYRTFVQTIRIGTTKQ